ncbi:histidine kinase [Thioalkalivibrio denitrificans]|uniref:Histidine kinase n=1 Tax=Thioalkalivibrio denitrificans TaxID=108003 RepID=A0A1V3NDV5_9GAMM|nr:CBS domain-containing protein [Thioalkalivibrio denitrificans]OOG22976.1 histidine kinase [Thioalkalivibrio denitrificans]
MQVGEFCNREVIIIGGDESVKAAAELMRRHHVGDVVLVEEREGRRIPVGIITDRDLVLEVMVPGLDPEALAVKDIVTSALSSVRVDDSLFDALEMMRAKAVRRLPVVDADGALAGILAVDDVMALLTEMLGHLSAVVERQRSREASQRP